jgi:hypothetical protein
MTVITDSDNVEMTAKILKVNDNLHCVEIKKKRGPQMEFYSLFNKITEFFGEYNDAAYPGQEVAS